MYGHHAQNLLILRSLQISDRDIHAIMNLYRQYVGFWSACKGSAMLSHAVKALVWWSPRVCQT